MNSFNLPEISQLTEAFIKRNQRLAYHVNKLEEDERHVLYQATNLFSHLYCQITADISLIEKWQDLQEKLFKYKHAKANRYLVYVVPDSVVKRSHLYEELTRAEQDDKFFRKVFISLPDKADKSDIERSLSDRIPLWFEERNEIIRQYVPLLSDVIRDNELLTLLSHSSPSEVVKAIENKEHFAYLLEERGLLSNVASGLQESAQINARSERGARITRLKVQNFRRFENKSIDLDGDVVLIYGRNGTGKTTICDALELSIFPELRRLSGDPDIKDKSDQAYTPFIRLGPITEHTCISVTGKVGDKTFSLETTVTPNATVKSLNGETATHKDVVKFLTRNENVDKVEYLPILLYTHFLGQHSIRDFIYGNRLEESQNITTTRFNLLVEMFGFGEVENLKKRLTKVLANITRSKINDAVYRIDTVNSQIRGLQHKYGPKSRQDLEKKGYQIAPEHALSKYHHLLDRLAEPLGSTLVKQIIVADPPMENYRSSCESIRNLLSANIKKLEEQATGLRKLGRLMMKISSIFPEINLLNTDSVKKSIEEIRGNINNSIKVTEQARCEIQVINANIDSLNDQIAQLQQFSERYDNYITLLGAERKEVETLNSLQNRRNDLLQQQSHILVKLQKATVEEQSTTKLIVEMEQRMHKHMRLLELLPGTKTAEIALQQLANRVATIDTAIAQAARKLSELDTKNITSSGDESLLDWESLYMDTHYKCPCCGTNYEDRIKLEQGIDAQLNQGKFRQELRKFITDIAIRNTESVRTQLLETVRLQTREKQELERSKRAQTKIIAAFNMLVDELGTTLSTSEIDLREAVRKDGQDVERMRQAMVNQESKALRDEAAKIQAELSSLKDDSHKKHLSQIRSEILQLTRAVSAILPNTDLQVRKHIQSRLETLSAEALACTTRREHLLSEIRAKSIADERVREIDECVSELESLSLEQDALHGYTLDKAPALADEILAKQKTCYQFLAEVDDLSKLFGLLTAQESGETLRDALKEYEKEKSRWTICYQSIEKINTDLSKLSYLGLQESLAQYGPLINQIYRKFIRHDVFSALVLEPIMGQKARRRDLYLRLKRYSGETDCTPASYLSEAQLNILALSIFLTRVMYQNISTLETVFIDDPIQQMDDMNTAAFVDVVLGLSHIGKQIIITTCNHDFYRLVAHKMHSVSSTGKMSFKTVDLDAQMGDLRNSMQH